MFTFVAGRWHGRSKFSVGFARFFSLLFTILDFFSTHSFVRNVYVHKMKMSTYIIDYDSTIICNDLYNIRRKNGHFHNEHMMKARAVGFFLLKTFILHTAQLANCKMQLHFTSLCWILLLAPFFWGGKRMVQVI